MELQNSGMPSASWLQKQLDAARPADLSSSAERAKREAMRPVVYLAQFDTIGSDPRCVAVGSLYRALSTEDLAGFVKVMESGRIDELAYDYDGLHIPDIIADSCSADFMRKAFAFLRSKWPDIPLAGCDNDGISTLGAHADNPEKVAVYREFGYDPDNRAQSQRLSPFPSSSSYEPYWEARFIESMGKVAETWHAGRFRKDGVTPFVEHPKAVAARLADWCFTPDNYGWVQAVGLGHDLYNETPREKWPELDRDVERATDDLNNRCIGKHVVAGIKFLTRDTDHFPTAGEFVSHIAEIGKWTDLAVAIADRLCNTMERLVLDPSKGGGTDVARTYFENGTALFKVMGRCEEAWCRKCVLASVEAVRAKLA